MHIKTTVR